MSSDSHDVPSYRLPPCYDAPFMVPLTQEIDKHPGEPNILSRHSEAEQFMDDFLLFSPDEDPLQPVATGSSTSNSLSSSTLTTPSKQSVVQASDEPALYAPISLPFNGFVGSTALVRHEYTYTFIPCSVALILPAPAPEQVLDAPSIVPITEILLPSSPPPRPPTPEVSTSVPKRSKAASRKRKLDTTLDDQEAPPLACEKSHRKRRRTWRHVEGLERLPGRLEPSTLEKVHFSLNAGGIATGYKLDMERFGLTKDVFVCGERLRQGCSQRGTSDILELGDKELCGMVFLAEQSLRRHLRTSLSHVGRRPCQKCGGMYTLRRDGYDRHVRTCSGPRPNRASRAYSRRPK